MKRLTGKLALLAVLVALFAALTVSASAEEQGIRIQMGLYQNSFYGHWHGSYITIEKDGELFDTISLTEEDMTNGLEEKEWTLTGEDYDPEAIYVVKFHEGENSHIYCAVTVWVDGARIYSTSLAPRAFLYTNCPHASYEGRVCTFCGYECPCTYSERDHETDTCILCGRSIPAEAIWGASADELTSRGTLAEAFTHTNGARYGVEEAYIRLIRDVCCDSSYDGGDSFDDSSYLRGNEITLDLNGHEYVDTVTLWECVLIVEDTAGGGKLSNRHLENPSAFAGLFEFFRHDGTSKLIINGGSFESQNCIISDRTHDYPVNVEINGGTFTAAGRAVYLRNAGSAVQLNECTMQFGANEGGIVFGEDAELTIGSDVVLTSTGSRPEIAIYCSALTKLDLSGWGDNINGKRVSRAQTAEVCVDTISLPAGYAFFDGETPVHALGYGIYTIAPHPTHEVSFDANGAEGEMRSVNTFAGYALPEPAFTVPEGKIFYGWDIGGAVYQPGDMPELMQDITAVADWRYDTDFVWGASEGDDSLGHGTWDEAFAVASAAEGMLYVQLNRDVSLTGVLAATTGAQGITLDLNGGELRLDNSVELSGLGLTVKDSRGGGKLALETADGLAPMFTESAGTTGENCVISFGAANFETNSYFIYSSPDVSWNSPMVLAGSGSEFTSSGPGFFYFGSEDDEALMSGAYHRSDGAATSDGAFSFEGAGDIMLGACSFTGDWTDCAHIRVMGAEAPGLSMAWWAGDISGLTVLCEDADHPAADHLPMKAGYAFFDGSTPVHVLEAGTVYTVGEHTTYQLGFQAGEGSGTARTIQTFTGYTLPTGDIFTPPEGKMFSGWLIGGEFYDAGDSVTLTQNRIATAQYVDDFDVFYGPSESELTGRGTLRDAFAALAGSGGYIKPNRSFSLAGGEEPFSAEHAGSGSVTLDLAGYKITVDKPIGVTGGGRLTVTDSSEGRGELTLEAADAVTPMFRVIAVGEQVSALHLMSGNFVTNGYFIRSDAEGQSECSYVIVYGGEFTSNGSGGFYLANDDDKLYAARFTFHAKKSGALADRAFYADGEGTLSLSSYSFAGTWNTAHIRLGPAGVPNLDLTSAIGSVEGTMLAVSVDTPATDIRIPKNYAFCTASGYPQHLLEGGFAYEIASYPTYELRFDPNGAAGSIKTVYTFSGYVLPECTFTAPEGTAFAGWLIDTTVYRSGETIDLTQDTSAIAQWKTPAVLSFDPNGGVGNNNEPLSGFVGYGIELPEPAFSSPVRNKFIGWEIDGIFYEVGDTYYFSSTEATATAQYRETYCVWFGENPYYVFVGESIAAPECNTAPPEEGYVFLGWVEKYGDKDTVYAFGQQYTPTGENVQLLAKWGVTVSFDPNGGSGTMDAMNAGVGDPFYVVGCGFEPPEGKVFTHWFTEGGGVCYPDTTIVLDAPITLVAQWKTPVMVGFAVANEYGDAEVYDMRDIFAEDGFVLPECEYPAPEGMAFSHWIIQGGDGTRYDANTEVALSAGEVVFVAQWRDASFGAEWSVSGTTLNVTLGESAQTLVRRIIFAEYGANGQLSGVQIALPESGECSFVRGAGEAKLFFLDENSAPVLAAQNVFLNN